MATPKLPDPPFSLKDLLHPVPQAGKSVTNTPDEVRAMRDRAGQDLVDIGALRGNEQFTRFFLRRVRQKRDAAIHSLITAKVDPVQREAIRAMVLTLEEVLTLLEDDEQAARTLLA
jgi:hypothetical protein